MRLGTVTDGEHRVSFDRVVEVMKQTGHDLPSIYKETGEGGLARSWEAPTAKSVRQKIADELQTRATQQNPAD